MDTAPSGFSAGENGAPERAERAPSRRFQWVWASVALGAAYALVTMSLQQIARTVGTSLVLSNSFVYTQQAQLNAVLIAVDALTLPVIVVASACVVAFRTPEVRRRGAAVARLLGALALLIGIAWFQQIVTTTGYRVLTAGQTAASAASAASAAANVVAMIVAGASGLLLGLTIAVAFGLLPSWLAPRGNARWLGYVTLASVFAGATVALFTQVDRFLLLTVLNVRLTSVGLTGCTAGSGSGCYGGQLLDMVSFSVLPLLIGAAVGGAFGGVISPDLAAARSSGSAVAPPIPMPGEGASAQIPGRRRSRGAEALRYIAGGAVGVVYLVIALSLIFLAIIALNSNRVTSPAPTPYSTQLPIWSLTLVALSLLIPAAWLALAATRARFASALSQGGKRAVRWTLTLLAVSLAVATPAIATLTQSVNYLNGLTVIVLAAFSCGAAYGLLWAPQPSAPPSRTAWRAGVRAAATGWLGVSLPVVILLGVALYSLITYTPSPTSCHGLGCGALSFLLYDAIMTVGVNIIVFGLPAALFAGGMSGMIREALRAP